MLTFRIIETGIIVPLNTGMMGLGVRMYQFATFATAEVAGQNAVGFYAFQFSNTDV